MIIVCVELEMIPGQCSDVCLSGYTDYIDPVYRYGNVVSHGWVGEKQINSVEAGSCLSSPLPFWIR